MPFVALMRNFYVLLQGNRATLAAALATLAVATLLKFVTPVAIKITLDYVFNTDVPLSELLPSWLEFVPDRLTLLVMLGGIVFVASLINLGMVIWSSWLAAKAVRRMRNTVRRKLFQHALGMPLDRIYGFMSGGVAAVLRNDAAAVGHLVSNMLYTPLQAAVQVLGAVIVLAWVAPWLLLGAVVTLPVVYFAHRSLVRVIRPIHRDIRQLWQEIDSHVTEVVSGIRVVRTYGRQRSEVGRYAADNHLLTRLQFRAFGWEKLAVGIWGTAIPAVTAMLLVYGGSWS